MRFFLALSACRYTLVENKIAVDVVEQSREKLYSHLQIRLKFFLAL